MNYDAYLVWIRRQMGLLAQTFCFVCVLGVQSYNLNPDPLHSRRGKFHLHQIPRGSSAASLPKPLLKKIRFCDHFTIVDCYRDIFLSIPLYYSFIFNR